MIISKQWKETSKELPNQDKYYLLTDGGKEGYYALMKWNNKEKMWGFLHHLSSGDYVENIMIATEFKYWCEIPDMPEG